VAAITPGQAVVCYDGEQLLGGGWIDVVTGPAPYVDAATADSK
jgi:tRNA methyl transferase